MKKKYLEIGKIVGTHALKGEVRVEIWCDTPEFFCKFKKLYLEQGNKEIKVKSKPHKRIALMQIEGVDEISKVNPYIGKILYMDRNEVKLPENQYFIQDLIGLQVKNIDTLEEYGEVTEIFKTGSNDVYEVKQSSGKSFLLPVIDEIVKDINIEENVVLITPMKGLFGDED